MDELDWSIFIAEWQNSIGILVDTNQLDLIPRSNIKWYTCKHAENQLVEVAEKKYVDRKSVVKKEPEPKNRKLKYHRVEREMFKAKLFIINEGIAGTFGVWIPKSAIVKENYPNLEYQSWVNYREVDVS